MSLSFLYIFNFVAFLSSFIKLFVVVCFLFFLKFSLSLLGFLPCWGLRFFGFWPSQLGFAVWNAILLLLLLLLLSDRLQTPTDRAKCHKPEGTSREGNPKKEKINKNEGKKDKNTL